MSKSWKEQLIMRPIHDVTRRVAPYRELAEMIPESKPPRAPIPKWKKQVAFAVSLIFAGAALIGNLDGFFWATMQITAATVLLVAAFVTFIRIGVK